jgi:hypothetical protein
MANYWMTNQVGAADLIYDFDFMTAWRTGIAAALRSPSDSSNQRAKQPDRAGRFEQT